MGMIERAVHIKNLIALKDFCNNNGVFTLASNIDQSLDYAIFSIKTDLLMYEGEEVFTKADMVAMLEQLDSEIQEQIAFMGEGEEANGMKRTDNLVKDKINALKQSIWQDNCNVKKE